MLLSEGYLFKPGQLPENEQNNEILSAVIGLQNVPKFQITSINLPIWCSCMAFSLKLTTLNMQQHILQYGWPSHDANHSVI